MNAWVGLSAALFFALAILPSASAQTPARPRIAFECGPTAHICVMDQDGTNVRDPGAGNMIGVDPKWSHDGTQIAFSQGSVISLLNADGLGSIPLSATAVNPSTGSVGYPTWSPDGSKIAYAGTPDFSTTLPQIFVVGISPPSGVIKLTADSAGATAPAWSPDGKEIVYTRGGGGLDLIKINADGSNPTPLGQHGLRASWSPDSAHIAFGFQQGVYVMDRDGSNVRLLADLGPTLGQFAYPTWSLDGKRIAFRFLAANHDSAIGAVNVAGNGSISLIYDPGIPNSAGEPDWQWGPCAGAGGDSDGDGLCDDWEKNGLVVMVKGQPELVDLPQMGADPMHKDIFIQADYMDAFDHSHQPKLDAIALVAGAFANAPVSNPDETFGINLHVDCGPNCIMNPNTGDPWGALSQAHVLAHQDQIGSLDSNRNYVWSDFDTIKQANFSDARKPVFHYLVFAHDLGGLGSTSGISRGVTASDFIVSLGSWTYQAGTTLEQAGTLMHELGHNLSLRHGGGDGINNKPNYLSVMNYSFQTSGLIINGNGGNLDYSRFTPPPLLETNLNESIGLNIGGASVSSFGTWYFCPGAMFATLVSNVNNPINWNCNLNLGESGASGDINGDNFLNLLTSFTDWPALVFRGGTIGQLGAAPLPSATPDLQEITPEIDARIPKPLRVAVAVPGKTQTAAGSSIDLAFRITNTGTQNDTYNLSTNATTAWASFAGVPASVTLSSGASISYTIHVAVPAGAAAGASAQFSIRAASRAAPLVQDTGSASVSVPPPALPVTLASLNPPPDASGGNNTNVTVMLSAAAASGIRSITYSATGAQTIASTTVNGSAASFTITAKGATTVSFFAQDNAGNVEAPKTLTVRIGPVIDKGGVVNGGSFDPQAPIAPGAIISIFGSDLAPDNALAGDIPLPLSLNNVSVTINGESAPLYFVSSRQINVQAPWDLDTSRPAQVIVINNSVSSPPEPAQTQGVSPAVIGYQGHAIAINLDADLAADPGSIPGLTTHPVARGQAILLYVTGLGAVDHNIPKGGIPDSGTLVYAKVKPTILLDGTAIPDSDVIFWGLTPQFVGVNQINIIIPPDAPTGDSVSIQVSTGGLTSPANAATLAIQ